MLVRDLRYEEDLPEEFLELLPDECSSCGCDLEISESLTSLSCSNPRCWDKIACRVKGLCKYLNILYFGEKEIEKFVDYYEVTNPLCMFELEEGMLLHGSASPVVSEKVITQIQEKRYAGMSLSDLIMYAGIPHVMGSAKKIFKGFNTLTEAYEEIESGGIDFIQDRLGIRKDKVSVQAIKVFESLIEFKEDLLEGEALVKIDTLGDKKELNIVCSNQAGGGFKTKQEFYNYMKQNFSDRFVFNFLGSVNTNINYLVWAGADGSPARYTSKVKKVENYQAKGIGIPIVTADQLIEELEVY